MMRLTTLREAYEQLGGLLPEVEPFEALDRAEAHRAFWRPPAGARRPPRRVARLHRCADLDRAHRPSPRRTRSGSRPHSSGSSTASATARTTSLTVASPKPPNGGTPQFWQDLCELHRRIAAISGLLGLSRSSVRNHVRVANKLALLGRLREAGVWLLDASPAALYGPGGHEAELANRSSRPSTSATSCTSVMRIEAAAPSEVICVGKGVGDVLATRLRRTGATSHRRASAERTVDHRRARRRLGRLRRGRPASTVSGAARPNRSIDGAG